MASVSLASSCSRKIGYDTRAAARMAIKSMQRKGKPINSLTVYGCIFCHKIHIGTKTKKHDRRK